MGTKLCCHFDIPKISDCTSTSTIKTFIKQFRADVHKVLGAQTEKILCKISSQQKYSDRQKHLYKKRRKYYRFVHFFFHLQNILPQSVTNKMNVVFVLLLKFDQQSNHYFLTRFNSCFNYIPTKLLLKKDPILIFESKLKITTFPL